MSADFGSLINVDRYPLHQPDSARYARLVDQCRDQFRTKGLCLLDGFLTDRSLSVMQSEAAACLEHTYYSESRHDVNLNEEEQRTTGRVVTTKVGSIPFDRIGEYGKLKQLYRSESMLAFVQAVLGKPHLYHLADPLGACSINVFTDGGEHGWHYDEAEFTVTLLLRRPQQGGSFEYVPMLRGVENERDQIARILRGDSSSIVELPFTEGTLLIFGGRQTLHRVSKVSGSTPRLVPVLCYSERPHVKNSEAVRKMFWGRAI